jgi:hypothetical protein
MCRVIPLRPYLGVVQYRFSSSRPPLSPPPPLKRIIKDEWQFFADVQQRLASGEPLVTYFFAFPPGQQFGLVLDELGNEYELSEHYTYALSLCIQCQNILWHFCPEHRLIYFGPGLAAHPQAITNGDIHHEQRPGVFH